LWFTYKTHYAIGHLTTAGKYTQFDETKLFAGVGIASGFGQVWVTGDQPGVGSPQAQLAHAPAGGPFRPLDMYVPFDAGGIAISGNLVWYAYVAAYGAEWNIASADVHNRVTTYNRHNSMPGYLPAALTIGPGGTSLWFTLPGAWQRTGYIGKLTIAN
jgi:hypothetical protein